MTVSSRKVNSLKKIRWKSILITSSVFGGREFLDVSWYWFRNCFIETGLSCQSFAMSAERSSERCSALKCGIASWKESGENHPELKIGAMSLRKSSETFSCKFPDFSTKSKYTYNSNVLVLSTHKVRYLQFMIQIHIWGMFVTIFNSLRDYKLNTWTRWISCFYKFKKAQNWSIHYFWRKTTTI